MIVKERCLYYLYSKGVDITRTICITTIELHNWFSQQQNRILSRMSDKE